MQLRVVARSAFHLLPTHTRSFLDYWLRGNFLLGLARGPFNGQAARATLVLQIIQCMHLARIVETGTHRGVTTRFLSEHFSGPLATVESDARYFYFARHVLRHATNVSLHLGSSVDFLKASLPCWQKDDRPTLFYLDAHWENYLPLKEELQIIFEHAQQFLILIDDFCVPHDAGYGYDNYGDGKSLELAYLRPLSQYRFAVFFPTVPSDQETGYRRGCVVLARGDTIIDQLSTWSSLRRDDSL
jgi:hypothetical protein